MSQKRVYDLPTRLFHLTFSISFIIAFIVAKTFDDESASYAVHMILGIVMGLAVLLRCVWGVIGSEHARFNNFQFSIIKLLKYFKDLIKSKTELYNGHNPASSFAAIFMMACSIGLVVTGFFMVQKIDKEVFEEVHEIFAHLFFLLSVLHIVGIVLHTVKHEDPIALSMLNGKKNVSNQSEDVKNHTSVGIIYLVIIFSSLIYLFANYSFQTGDIKVFGNKINLVEVEDD